jgi:outer membrane lipoprotein carrier protein
LCSGISQAETAKEAAARLQNRYDQLSSLTFEFIQDTRGQLAGRPKTGRGKAFFVKNTIPGKMRWNYSTPDRQVLVSNGETFSMYFESLQQMIVTPAKALQQDLTYSFFTGTGNLLEDFSITPSNQPFSDQNKQDTIIKLTPKDKQTQVASIQLWITEDSLIRRIEILDHFDTLTVLNISNLQPNGIDTKDKELIKRLFDFTPPEGTEIIQQ